MKKLIGNVVRVFLKSTERGTADPAISGILVEIDNDAVYVHSVQHDNVFVVPLDNVSYCTIDNMPSFEKRVIPTHTPKAEPESEFQLTEQETSAIDRLNVYINKRKVASIPVPPTFPTGRWSDQILRVIMGNPEVKANLTGKIQQSIDYYPGEVYIKVTEVEPPSQIPEQSDNTFSMGGSPTTEYLNPAQMAARLRKVAGGGNDGPTNV